MENFDEWVEDMHRLMDQDGIVYKGQFSFRGQPTGRDSRGSPRCII